MTILSILRCKYIKTVIYKFRDAVNQEDAVNILLITASSPALYPFLYAQDLTLSIIRNILNARNIKAVIKSAK
jgi:hypothetical protein